MPLELSSWDDIAMTELEMLDEKACTIKGLVAADTAKLLVDFMI